MNMHDIEGKTKDYAGARAVLADRVQRLNNEVEAARKRFLPGIKKAVDFAVEKKADLAAAIEQGAALFNNPRTVVFSGIKVGLQKGKGAIEWDNDDQVIRLIEKNFPDLADVLIKTTKKPIKKALGGLSVAELKKIGVAVEETGDQVVIKGTDSDVDKLVKVLLKEHESEECEAIA